VGMMLPEGQLIAAEQAWSVRMADSVIRRHSPGSAQWHYEHGLVLLAIERVWRATGEARFWNHVKETVDLFIDWDGAIRTYNLEEYNLDQINPGRALFPLYQATGEERYKRAIMRLRQQLDTHPRTAYRGIIRDLIAVDAQGLVTLERVCAVAGLGGDPYRDGTFTYYVNERIAANDYKGVGPFILASLELESSLGENQATIAK